jgi:alpha/beta superfamily hydrolase
MPEIIFNGPAGRLEGRYKPGPKDAPVALILHPHPQHGGTMNNKVVYNLYHSFAKRGFATLRFNFRGVGRSQGAFDRGEGELNDAATALDWLQIQHPDSRKFWIGGFSFGAWIAMQLLMRRPEIESFIAIAPPANMYDFSFLAPCPTSGLMVVGEQDQIVPSDSVVTLASRLSSHRGIKVEKSVIPGADHFFRTGLDEMTQTVDGYLDAHL